jgi:hypothetical protein
MLRKKRSPSTTAFTPTVTARPTAEPNPYDPFRYNADNMLSFQCNHPQYEGYTTWYSLKEGGTVAVVTPFHRPEAIRFRLADLPFETWVALTDKSSRPIPLMLHVDSGGVLGRWLV